MNEENKNRQVVISNYFFKRIADQAAQACCKVCFDIKKLKKPEKAYSMYGIPKDERILAFCKGVYLFMPAYMDGIIFTDKAVHFYATLEKDTASKIRNIPYTLFGQYVFVQEGKKGRVVAYSENEDIQIYNLTLIAENVAGTEILSTLTAIQEELCKINSTAREERNILVKKLLSQAGEQLGIGGISKRSDTILNQLLCHKAFADDAALMKAEFIFREGEIAKYEGFIDSISSSISAEMFTRLKGIPSEFVSKYINILTDWNSTYSANAIAEAYRKTKNVDVLPKPYRIIRAYLSVRMCDFDTSMRFIAGVRKACGNTEANRIEWFKGLHGYHLMRHIYEAIKNDGEIPDNSVQLCDGLGLTPLHYALILKNESAISFLLEKATWLDTTTDEENSKISVYDYTILAYGKQIKNKEEILKRTHKGVSASVKRIEVLNQKLAGMRIKLRIQETNLSIGKNKRFAMIEENENNEKILELTDKIELLREYIEESRMRIDVLLDMIREEEYSLRQAMEKAEEDALRKLGEMGTCEDPFIKYIYRVYFEPDFFESVLRAIENKDDLRLYRYENYYFIAPLLAQIDLLCVDDSSWETEDYPEEKKNVDGTPPDGTSWFSPEAHRDVQLLKKEYRKLAKTFHPDVSRHPDSNRLFKIISVEYSTILREIDR